MVGRGTENGAAIELRHLSRHFGATRAVDDVTLTIAYGSVCGFVGPNGAGKTTTMRILATLDAPTSGNAFVCGMSSVVDADRVRRVVGFMPDSYGIYKNVCCHEYLDFFARAYGLVGRQREARVRRIMEFTGVDKLADKQMAALSKGMRQRLCLGRALIHDPRVLILDEPAAGLDPRARRELRDMIGELAAAGTTILVSSHILTELAEMVNEICIIEQGRLLASGSVAEMERRIAPHQVVAIHLLADHAQAVKWLADHPDVLRVDADGEMITIEHRSTDAEASASLLRALIEQGFPVVEFTRTRRSLEDVFLHVTDGIVQ